MSKKVVTLGEIMLRLSTPDYKRFVQADTFDVTYGGGEANVAAALSNYGLKGTFVTKVPNNAIGQSAINHLRRYGVERQYIVKGGGQPRNNFCVTSANDTAVTKTELNIEGFKDLLTHMKQKSKFKYIVSSLREIHTARHNGWRAFVYAGNEFDHARKYQVRIIDRVGSGDSLASGVIY